MSERKHAPANKAHAGKLSSESFHNKNGGALFNIQAASCSIARITPADRLPRAVKDVIDRTLWGCVHTSSKLNSNTSVDTLPRAGNPNTSAYCSSLRLSTRSNPRAGNVHFAPLTGKSSSCSGLTGSPKRGSVRMQLSYRVRNAVIVVICVDPIGWAVAIRFGESFVGLTIASIPRTPALRDWDKSILIAAGLESVSRDHVLHQAMKS